MLKTQITSPNNPGIGIEAKQIIGRIEKLLGRKLTPITQVNNNASGYSDLANRMEEQIVEMVYNLSPEEKNLMTDINNAVLKWDKEIPAILALSNNEIDKIAQEKIDQSLNEYNKLGGKASSILGSKTFKFEPLTTDTSNIGKLGYAFGHAIKNFGFSQFMVLAGCILLDFVIVIIILLVTNPDNNSNKNGSVFNNKRGGKTLIPKN